MSRFLTINKASGQLRIMGSDGDISMIARSGTPLYLNSQDPFIEDVIPPTFKCGSMYCQTQR